MITGELNQRLTEKPNPNLRPHDGGERVARPRRQTPNPRPKAEPCPKEPNPGGPGPPHQPNLPAAVNYWRAPLPWGWRRTANC